MADHDVHVGGDVLPDNGLLWVHGDVTIDGRLSGLGSIFATGSVRVSGHIQLRASDAATQPAIWAGGELRLGQQVVTSIR